MMILMIQIRTERVMMLMEERTRTKQMTRVEELSVATVLKEVVVGRLAVLELLALMVCLSC